MSIHPALICASSLSLVSVFGLVGLIASLFFAVSAAKLSLLLLKALKVYLWEIKAYLSLKDSGRMEFNGSNTELLKNINKCPSGGNPVRR